MFSTTSFDSTTKIWSGTKSGRIFDKTRSVGELILEGLDCEPEQISQISDNNGLHLTRADIKSRSLKVAKFIENQGLKPGDVVASIARNTHNLAPSVFGAILNATPVNTLDVNFRKDDYVNMFQYTKPKFVFCDADTYDVVKESLEFLNWNPFICTVRGQIPNVLSIEDIFRDISDEEASTFVPAKIEDAMKTTAVILCSSGTTGLPKGVCVTHAQLSAPMAFADGKTSIKALCFSPIFWISGLKILLVGAMNKCVRVITDESFTPELMLRMVEEYEINFLFGPPSYMALLLSSPEIKTRNLSSIRLFMSSGGHLSPSMWKEMAEYLPNGMIFTSFLMTEVPLGCTLTIPHHKSGSVGHLTSDVQVKILDDDGNQLGINENGEICIKSFYEFLGYYQRPDETAKILDAEGWIHSGDIGHIDEEGFMFLVDRKKDILKYKGYHYFPGEIESVIVDKFDVLQVCVCGIVDSTVGDLPAALVVKNDGLNTTEKDIVDYVAKSLADFKHLRGGVYFVDSLPMTTTGKYVRAKVREIATKYYADRK